MMCEGNKQYLHFINQHSSDKDYPYAESTVFSADDDTVIDNLEAQPVANGRWLDNLEMYVERSGEKSGKFSTFQASEMLYISIQTNRSSRGSNNYSMSLNSNLTSEMNGIFAIEKPVGISSAKVLAKLQSLFNNSKVFIKDLEETKSKVYSNFYSQNPNKKPSRRYLNSRIRVKMGHGGTLDVEASGVLVVGVGSGTKLLQSYLTDCIKAYETDAVLGASTTSGDAEGELLMKTDVRHITTDQILETAAKFTGTITQTPPIFSAIKMNGKPLYEYAREKKPLPQPIKSREVVVHLLKFDTDRILTKNHKYKLKKPEVDEDGKTIISKLAEISNIDDNTLSYSKQYIEATEESGKHVVYPKPVPIPDDFERETLKDDYIPPLIHFTATVSSGTYIRSLVSDIGKSLGSSAYMVALLRTKQAEWEQGKNTFQISDFENYHEEVWGEVLKWILKNGAELNVKDELEKINKEFLLEHPGEQGKTYPIPEHVKDERKDGRKDGRKGGRKDERKHNLDDSQEPPVKKAKN